MGDLVRSATAILANASWRAEIAAHNITNISTPGYRARTNFASLYVRSGAPDLTQRGVGATPDMSPGRLIETGNSFDLSISGDGFFALSDDSGTLLTRNGQFSRNDEGLLIGVGGRPVQAQGGGDVMLESDAFTIAADGTVLVDDNPVARLAILRPMEGMMEPGPDGLLRVSEDNLAPAEASTVRQGFLESSNVSLGDETVALMEAVRHAEMGQRMMNVYDDLMGRVITSVGQAS